MPKRTDGSELDPRESHYSEICANLASLNEIVSALHIGLAEGETIDEEYVDLVVTTLKEHNWRLGFLFNEQGPTAEWLAEEDEKPWTP